MGRRLIPSFTEIRTAPLPLNYPAHAQRNNDGEEINDEDSNVALQLNRPQTTECPRPQAGLSEWLKPGWRDVNGEVEIHPTRNRVSVDGRTSIEAFDDDHGR